MTQNGHALVARIRQFNRFYTRILGLLREGMHKSHFSLAEARVVHELGRPGPSTAGEIAAVLDMDRGQMSRLIWKLTEEGHVATRPDVGDRRRNVLALTDDGQHAYEELESASDAAVGAMIADLSEEQKQHLVTAMETVEGLLSMKSEDTQVSLRAPRLGELGTLIERQARLYNREYGWNEEFEALIARIYGEFSLCKSPKALWVAERAGQIAGSIFVVPSEEEGMAQLRMLYVEPEHRGHGIGTRLVAEAVHFARNAGWKGMRLWTQDCLVSARRVYQAAGFTLEREEPHHSFGVNLNGQYWVIDL
ncbi:GNAT family N-acetyltransferase [Devosia pacifica]|uniref:GNAT family N-acetyltransferase n=1 Tax=Devosia pacifica TaxID=1335967 RepID=A0A918VWP1_9HYPH|nr:helix-turn-helix domain-containing GNAT family N-acetyltransferase [Devosia pacifica]GHA31876.1 GNAT family N-acetyltransferase [Devosia pacifica]